MGYAYYRIPTRDGRLMRRGYSVECVCHKRGCKEKIDRGMAFLCYHCTHYFCGAHLFCSVPAAECFAGRSHQVCEKCKHELENAHKRDTVTEALANAKESGYDFKDWTVQQICEDMVMCCAELEEYEPKELERFVRAELKDIIKARGAACS